MNINTLVDKIFRDVTKLFSENYAPSLYIGKTEDIERRSSEHKDEGFAYILKIANGDADKISELEEALISKFSNEKKMHYKILNKSTLSAGNKNATWLYICIDNNHPNDELCEDDSDTLLGHEYPLSLNQEK